MDRRKMVYKAHPDEAKAITSGEEKGEYSGERTIYSADDTIPLSIEYLPEVISYSYPPLTPSTKSSTPLPPAVLSATPLSNAAIDSAQVNKGLSSTSSVIEADIGPISKKLKAAAMVDGQKRYLRCVAAVTIRHLKKLIRNKYDLKYHHDVEMFYKHDLLLDEFSILDLAYIYSWKRNGPLALYYKITDLRRTEFSRNNKTTCLDEKSADQLTHDSSNKSTVSVSTSPIPCNMSPPQIKSPSIAQLNSKSTSQGGSVQNSAQNSSKSKSHTNTVKAVSTSTLPSKANVKQVETVNSPTINASMPRKHANENNPASGNSKNSSVTQHSVVPSGRASSNNGINSSTSVTTSPANTPPPQAPRRSRGKGKRPLTVREIVDGVTINGSSSPTSEQVTNQVVVNHQPHLLPKPTAVTSMASNFFCSTPGATGDAFSPLTFANGLSLSPSVSTANAVRSHLGQIMMPPMIPTTLPAQLISQFFPNSSLMPIGSNSPVQSAGVVQASNSAFTRLSEPPVIQANLSPVHPPNVSSPAASSPSLTMCSPNANSNSNNNTNTNNSSNSPLHQQASSSSNTTVTGQSPLTFTSSTSNCNAINSNSTSQPVATSSNSTAESDPKSPPSPSSALAIAQQVLPQSTTVTAIKDSAANKLKAQTVPKRIDGVIEKLQREKDFKSTGPSTVSSSTNCSVANTTDSPSKLNTKSITVGQTNSTALATVAPIAPSTVSSKIASISPSTDRTTASTTLRALTNSLTSSNSSNTISRSSHIPILPAFDKKPIGSHPLPIHPKHVSSNTPLASVKPMPSSNQVAQNTAQNVNETSDRSKEGTKETLPPNNQVVPDIQSNPKDSLDDKKGSSFLQEADLRAIMAQAGKLYSDSTSPSDG